MIKFDRFVIDTSALFQAVTLKSVKATEKILKAGGWISEGLGLQTELHEVCTNGSIEILEMLLGDPRITSSDINKADACNRTPMYKAAQGGHKECLKLLIERGGDLGHLTKTNETLMDAIFAHISKPATFVRELLDERITASNIRDNDENISIALGTNRFLTSFDFVYLKLILI